MDHSSWSAPTNKWKGTIMFSNWTPRCIFTANHNTLKREVRSSPTKILWGLGAAVSPGCFTYRRLGEGPPGLVNLYVLRFDQVVVFLGVGVLWIFVGCFCWINMFFFGKNGWNLMEPVVFFVGRFTMIVNGLPQFQGFAEFTVSFFLKFHQMVENY